MEFDVGTCAAHNNTAHATGLQSSENWKAKVSHIGVVLIDPVLALAGAEIIQFVLFSNSFGAKNEDLMYGLSRAG